MSRANQTTETKADAAAATAAADVAAADSAGAEAQLAEDSKVEFKTRKGGLHTQAAEPVLIRGCSTARGTSPHAALQQIIIVSPHPPAEAVQHGIPHINTSRKNSYPYAYVYEIGRAHV